MTVSAGIEVVAGAHLGPSQGVALGQVTGMAQGAAWSSKLGASSSLTPAPSSAKGAESFRTGLQALLASPSGDGDGLNLEEPRGTGNQPGMEAALPDAVRDRIHSNSTLGIGGACGKGAGAAGGVSLSAWGKGLPLGGDLAETRTWTAGANAPRLVAAEAIQRNPSDAPSKDSGHLTSFTRPRSSAKHEPASTGSKMAQDSGNAGDVMQVAPVPVTESPVENIAVAAPSSTMPSLPAGFPAGFALDSFNEDSLRTNSLSVAAGRLSTPGVPTSEDVARAERTVDLPDAESADPAAGTAIDPGVFTTGTATGQPVLNLATTDGAIWPDEKATDTEGVAAKTSREPWAVNSVLPAGSSELGGSITATMQTFDPAHRSTHFSPGPNSTGVSASGAGDAPQRPRAWAGSPPSRPVPADASASNPEVGPPTTAAAGTTELPAEAEAIQAFIMNRNGVGQSSAPSLGEFRNPNPAQRVSNGREAATVASNGGEAPGSPTGKATVADLSQSLPVPPNAGKAGLAGEDETRPSFRSARVSRATSPAGYGDLRVQGQLGNGSGDLNPLAREVSSTDSVASMAGRTAAGSVDVTAAAANRETFAALDAGNATAGAAVSRAGSHSAEAGFHDPALGWVGVRANSEGGGVHASLVPDSAGAAETLGGQMAGLSAYLAEQHAPVDSLTLAAPEHHTNPYGPDQNAGQGMQQGTGQQTGQGNDPETPSDSQQSLPASRTTPSPMEAAPNGGLGRNAEATRPGGQHVSVMA